MNYTGDTQECSGLLQISQVFVIKVLFWKISALFGTGSGNFPAGRQKIRDDGADVTQRAKEKLAYVVPFTLAIILALLFMNFRNFAEVTMIMGTLPLAMVGSVWLMYLQGFNFSIAAGVGFITLTGVAVEIGTIMLVYLNQAYNRRLVDCELNGTFPSGSD